MKSKLLINPDISKRDLTVSFQKTLEGTDVFFSFVWNKKRPIALVQLISTLGDNTEETDHLNNPIKDTDGELSV